MNRSLMLAVASALAPACTPQSNAPGTPLITEQSPASAPASGPALLGAVIGPAGFATIASAPPVPYPDAVPPDPSQAARDRDRRRESYMNPDEAAREAAFRLRDRLEREAGDNYVDVKVIRDPDPRFAFYFRRNAEEALARFTRDPRFKAVEGGVPEAELRPLLDEWSARFKEVGWSWHGSARTFEGEVEMNLGVPRSEFERVAAARGWPAPPPQVKLTFAREIEGGAAVAPDLRSFVRVFARADQSPGMVLSVANHGRIVLRDGCFRVDDGQGGGPMVLFGREAILRRDAQGWMTVRGPDSEAGARIGERMVWGGYPEPREDEPDVKALRARCGAGPITSVGAPDSAHRFRVRPFAISYYARAKSLTRQQAWDEIKACWAAADARPPYRPGDPPRPPVACDEPFGPTPPAPPPPPPLPRR